MQNVIDHLFVGPMWPATLLAAICLVYIALSFLGGVDLGLDADVDVAPDFDVDVTPDLDVSPDLDVGADADLGGQDVHSDLLGGVAAATLKAVHLDRVPLLVWLAIFAMFFWLTTFLLWFEFDQRRYEPTLLPSVLLSIRNAVISIVLTGIATRPIHRMLVPPKLNTPDTIIGGTAVVETHQADAQFGRAKFTTNAAPLLIKIRTRGEVIPKGESVAIINYDAATDTYEVVKSDTPIEPAATPAPKD